ncbi:hypothetical protein HPP92_019211 [Vanilla planifolia]|uniref:Uncharacterized protein n=1 Tax=Vanilla planifolia TaxID=51239 RepID=A0A835Q946_VANPL|nr:hypothetical protein HPP92_019721 [Vanilla planifolia]KAG0465047.1 hypothetical protein HPP92_019211 [Vanilla planifolia]
MAEVAELFPYLDGDDEEALELEEADGEAFDGSPYWPSALVPNLFSPIFSSGRRSSPSSSDHVDSTSDSSECVYNQIFFPHDDGFEHMPPSPPIDHPLPETLDFRNFRVLDAIDDCVDLDETDEGESGHRIFTGSRVTGGVPSAGGLRVVDLGSDTNSSSDDRGFAGPDFDSGGGASGRLEGDLGLPLCWDFLPIDDVRGDPSEDFEWEEVDDRLDGRGVLSMMVGIDDEGVSRGRGKLRMVNSC